MTATHTAPAAALEVAQLHPDALDIGENVRDSVDLAQTPDFVESIRENGVLEAISAVRTADGTIVVRDGQRRTFPRKWRCCVDASSRTRHDRTRRHTATASPTWALASKGYSSAKCVNSAVETFAQPAPPSTTFLLIEQTRF